MAQDNNMNEQNMNRENLETTTQNQTEKNREIVQAECCCCAKRTERPEDEYKRLLNRLSRIEGQIRGIRGMVENDAYCADILTQSAAASAALNAFNRELLASHIRGCVVRDIRDGKNEVIDELVMTIQKLMK
jgi:DNA-binding FrmR family transcriptional regulator